MHYKTRRRELSRYLIKNHFTSLEARAFTGSQNRTGLRKSDPTLQMLVRERNTRHDRFNKLFVTKIASGKWRPQDYDKKWIANLSRMYTVRGWRVKEGGRGKQQKVARGTPNPWAMYRAYQPYAPQKKYISPWEVQQLKGKTAFDRGQLFIQKAQKAGVSQSSRPVVKHWIENLTDKIGTARGTELQRLVEQRGRLQRLLGGA